MGRWSGDRTVSASGLRRELGKIRSNGMRAARAFKREHGHRQRVFCASLADVFDNQVPQSGVKICLH